MPSNRENTVPPDFSAELMALVEWQVAFGPRLPGTASHQKFIEALKIKISPFCDELFSQEFSIFFQQKDTQCENIIAVKKAAGVPSMKPLLIGTHFDTRLIADNEDDPGKINIPIPGANDGGSGTAIQIQLLAYLAGRNYCRDIHAVFFDAEDVGNIDGFEFSTGAQYLADHPLPEPPGEVLVLDMVGGKNLILDFDMHLFEQESGTEFAKQIMACAVDNQFMPLLKPKTAKYKYIICDHYPFLQKGIPSFILIDIDYPQWHTQADLPDAMSGESLGNVYDFVCRFLDTFLVSNS
ncbi:MAG: M28 family peptidase [Spirochaetales bacterium]|nr:M28 family peptidase [Spirochaetales bacterium]